MRLTPAGVRDGHVVARVDDLAVLAGAARLVPARVRLCEEFFYSVESFVDSRAQL